MSKTAIRNEVTHYILYAQSALIVIGKIERIDLKALLLGKLYLAYGVCIAVHVAYAAVALVDDGKLKLAHHLIALAAGLYNGIGGV